MGPSAYLLTSGPRGRRRTLQESLTQAEMSRMKHRMTPLCHIHADREHHGERVLIGRSFPSSSRITQVDQWVRRKPMMEPDLQIVGEWIALASQIARSLQITVRIEERMRLEASSPSDLDDVSHRIGVSQVGPLREIIRGIKPRMRVEALPPPVAREMIPGVLTNRGGELTAVVIGGEPRDRSRFTGLGFSPPFSKSRPRAAQCGTPRSPRETEG